MIISYDLPGAATARYGGTPVAGDVLDAMSRRTLKPTGTRYLVLRVVSVRQGDEFVRCRLSCERVEAGDGPSVRTWPLWWHPRGRRP